MRSNIDRKFLIAVWRSNRTIRLVCALVVAGLAWAVPAEGQTARDEGFPAKDVFPEEYPDVPGVEEACGPFEVPGAFGEGCVEHSGPDAFGPVAGAGGFPNALPDPVLRTAPRLECPAAVFVEEMETGSIDCHAYDEAGEEHLDYYWEPVEGAPRGYLDAPRLTGEDRVNPSIVAPSSPFYATLESFLSEDATLRYRYRLTATSRVTGLSSRAEVEVFVLLRRPSVYCPLEYEVSAGSEVVLSCEGADPLSFRMDYEAGSEVSWEWEGLWGSNASLLSASDTPSPLFRAPSDGAGETHHYIASMTTTSLGVPRTARRRVSVRVVKGEAAGAAASVSLSAEASAPRIECEDREHLFDVNSLPMICDVFDEPAGATYRWTARGGTPNTDALSNPNILEPTFERQHHRDDVLDVLVEKRPTVFEYKVSMLDSMGDEVAFDDVTVTLFFPDWVTCTPLEHEVYEGDPEVREVRFDCEHQHPQGRGRQSFVWTSGKSVPDTPEFAALWMEEGAPRSLERSLMFNVPGSLPSGKKMQSYQYGVCVRSILGVGRGGFHDTAGCQLVTVTMKRPEVAVACADPDPVYEGSDDISLSCEATGDPPDSEYAFAWAARGATANTDLLSALDRASPMFYVPDDVDADETYEYLLTVSVAKYGIVSTAEVTATVLNKVPLTLTCADPDSVYEGEDDIALSCDVKGAPPGSDYAFAWAARGATANTDLLSALDRASPTFYVPDDVDEDETYEYRVTVTAENAEAAEADVTVTVLNKVPLTLTCADPDPVYEGSDDIALSCEAKGVSDGASYVWAARGATANTDLLSALDRASPTFYVPDEVDADETYEYRVTVTAENAEAAAADVTVTVLNKGALVLTCADPDPVYEGSDDIALSCEAMDAPDGSDYAFAWEAMGDTPSGLLSAADVPSPMFDVPDEVDADETYEYRVTVTAENAEAAAADVTVTVLNKGALVLTCADPDPVYEGSDDIALSCEAMDAPDGSDYAFAWEAMGDTPAGLLSSADVPSPTFDVPEEVDADRTYEYRVTVTAENAEVAAADVTVTVLNKGALVLTCADPDPVYEGSDDIALSCEAMGAPDGSDYAFAWEAMGDTPSGLLSAADVPSPMFDVPDEVDADETYEYRVTVTAENAEAATADVTVTVLNKGALVLTCADPDPVYEGSDDIALSCEAMDAPDGSDYVFVWEAMGDTPSGLLSAADVPSPTFYVPDEVDETTRYEYEVTVSAENAEDAMAEVTVTVLDRPEAPAPPPTVAFSADQTSLGVTIGASSLRFGAQSSDTEVSLDPLTDRVSTSVSGPHHAGRMTLAPADDLSLGENGEMTLSIELVAPVALRHESGAASLALVPRWSIARSCDQLASESIGGLHAQTTLSESDCRLLRFGGELDLAGAAPGRYVGNIDVILRTGAGEETHSVEAEVTVVAPPRVITIGPGGVRFDASREIPAALTEEQKLSVYPDMAFMTRDAPSGAFELSNPSLVPLEVSVSARFGYAEATEDGREIVVEDVSASRFGDLSEIVNIYPRILTLTPGERGVVRYGVREEALSSLEEAGYAAFFEVTSSPRRYARADRLPEGVVVSDGTGRASMSIPGAYAPDASAPRLTATLLSLSEGASLAATFLLETDRVPFAGEAVAYDGEGRELGRSETLVYTRSRVRMPLDRLPEGETVLLRFTPRGSGRAPESVAVPWHAPRREGRDIGAARMRVR